MSVPGRNTGQPPKSKFFNGVNRPSGRWAVVSAVTLAIGLIGFVSYLSLSRQDASRADVKQMGPRLRPEDTVPGGKGTPAYNAALVEDADKKAAVATKNGQSFIPTPTGAQDSQLGDLKSNGPSQIAVAPASTNAAVPPAQQHIDREQAARAQQREDQASQAMAQAMMRQMSEIGEKLRLTPQTVTIYEERQVGTGPDGKPCGRQNQPPCPAPGNRDQARQQDVAYSDNKTGQTNGMRKSPVKPGTLLYAANDILLSSDGGSAAGTRATIVAGEYRGWVLLGSFTSGKESLAIHYITLVDPVGNDYAVTAYAVSPDTDKAAIATNVDNHMLERWGGLTAAAFLKGFGQATLLSGTQSVGGPLVNQGIGQSANPGYYGGYITQAPQYDLMQKGAVAMGEVGNQAAQQLSKNFNQPPTVTLAAGAPLGILFIK